MRIERRAGRPGRLTEVWSEQLDHQPDISGGVPTAGALYLSSFRRSNSASLAKFAAMRRASSAQDVLLPSVLQECHSSKSKRTEPVR